MPMESAEVSHLHSQQFFWRINQIVNFCRQFCSVLSSQRKAICSLLHLFCGTILTLKKDVGHICSQSKRRSFENISWGVSPIAPLFPACPFMHAIFLQLLNERQWPWSTNPKIGLYRRISQIFSQKALLKTLPI